MTVGYNYDGPIDAQTIRFMKAQAKKEHKSYAVWCQENGIITNTLESRIKKHEVPTSVLSRELQAELSERTDWYEDHPGGPQIPSVLTTGKVRFRKDMQRRPRGRPRKRFLKVTEEE